jgi:hypothetical protein
MGTKSAVSRRAGDLDKSAIDDASPTRRRPKQSSPPRSRQRSQAEISADVEDPVVEGAIAFARAADEFSKRYPGGIPLASLTPDVRDRVGRCREWALRVVGEKCHVPPDMIEPITDTLVGATWYLNTQI